MIAQTLMPEITQEYANTRKMLEKVPLASFAWKPHDKSMSLERLSTHIATLPQWVTITINTDELDLAGGAYAPEKFATSQEMLASFDAHVAKAKETLQQATDETMMKPWSLKKGGQLFFTLPKVAVLRTFAISHIIHHRAQLQVYLRMLDVSVPGMYGPSADEA